MPCPAAVFLFLLLILGHVIVQGLPALNPAFFTDRPLPPGEVGGGEREHKTGGRG